MRAEFPTRPEVAFDVYLLPTNKSEFTAAPADLRRVVAVARNVGDVRSNVEVRELLAKGYFVVETVGAGSFARVKAEIDARARRASWADEVDPTMRGCNDARPGLPRFSRPLGAG